jgi:xanthine dehydrogenase accessory factor
MHDIRSTLDTWFAAGEPVALATVLRTWGSAPRPPGAKLAVSPGEIAGSVSAGCVEAAVIEAAREVLASGRPQRLTFGVSDDTAWSVGLSCGGEIELWVDRLDGALHRTVTAAMDRGDSVAIVTAVSGPEDELGAKLALVRGRTDAEVNGMPPYLADAAGAPAREILAEGASRLIDVNPPPGSPEFPEFRTSRDVLESPQSRELFVDVILPRPTLAIVGAGHIALALVPMARILGYRTVVIDPREALATAVRFPEADRIVVDWPDAALAALPVTASTAIAVLSHDSKIDDPALLAALVSPACYVGALGSRSSQAGRRERLGAAGIGAAQLDRLHGPIGLDLGAQSPEEIALAILAEITAVRRARAK